MRLLSVIPMKNLLTSLAVAVLVLAWATVTSQQPAAGTLPRTELYYFHPAERCPIDQSIEETTRNLIRTGFAREIKSGTLKFMVVNTDDKASAKITAGFNINAQALYLVTRVNGKEVKNDLTEFAFSTCQSNPVKFKAGLKQELLDALK
jgi:hypothetical protein